VPRRAQKIVAGIYSAGAKRLYEPLVVHGSFRLLGGRLNDLVVEQGRRAVDAAAGGPILDVPVGTAYFTSAVARAHPGLVAGVDIAEGMARKAARVARDEGLSNLTVVQASAHDLPFPDEAFRAVLCTNGLQVIPDLRRAVEELARVLAPGGTLFVSVLGVPLPYRSLPTFLATARVATELERTGLRIRRVTRTRLATVVDATKA
jgi:ubiquinone/menaquinone biosynthesis C-methylase UbiE